MIVNNKMKGLLKGLRYISQIFDDEEEEKELQIGYPTDVKHVAHIGCDGDSTNALTWIGQYQSTSARDDANEKYSETPTKEISELRIDQTHSSSVDPHTNSPAKRRHRRRSSASESSLEADYPPNQEKESSKRGNRRSRHHSAGSTADPSSKEPSNENFRRNRRHSKPSSIASESSLQDVPSVQKQSRHRKSKEESSSAATIVAAVGIP